jgi:hypothetical protein
METHQAMFRAPEPPSGTATELYMADQPPPPRPYYEIALVQATGFGNEAHPENVARALAAKGGSLGCDAVIRTFLDQGYSKANASGVCVKWVGPPVQVVVPPLPPPPATTDPGSVQPPPQPPPTPAPKIEGLPSSDPSQGGGR